MSESEADLNDVAFIDRSDYRQRVSAVLHERGAGTPASLASDTGIAITHVSRSLSDLREEGLAELLVAEETRKGRFYGLTKAGRDVFERGVEMGRFGEFEEEEE